MFELSDAQQVAAVGSALMAEKEMEGMSDAEYIAFTRAIARDADILVLVLIDGKQTELWPIKGLDRLDDETIPIHGLILDEPDLAERFAAALFHPGH